MKGIEQIHLARTPFSIEKKARRQLQDYLDDIGARTPESYRVEMLEDIESRMVEILAVHQVTSVRTIVEKDVSMLRGQLGEPKDFADEAVRDKDDDVEDTAADSPTDEDSASDSVRGFFKRKLYRDEKRGMFAGVCYGIAKQLDIDALWIRLLFVGLLFINGIGFVVYIVLAILLPNVKDDADRLKMEGKPITIRQLQWFKSSEAEQAASQIQTVTSSAWRMIMKFVGKVFEWGVASVGVVAIILLLVAFSMGAGLLNGADVDIFGVSLVPDSGYIQIAVGSLLAIIASLILMVVLAMAAGLFKRKIRPIVTASVAVVFGLALLAFVGTAYPATRDARAVIQKRAAEVSSYDLSRDISQLELQAWSNADIYIRESKNGSRIELTGMVPNDVASMMQQSLDSKSVTLDMQRHQDKYATGYVSQCGLFCGELKPKITIYIDHPIALKVSNAANLVSVDAQLERLVVGNGIAFYGGPNRDIRATRDIKNLELTIDEMLIVDLGKAHILNARLIYASRDAPQVRMGVVDKLTVIRPDTENVCVTNVATTLPLQLIAASIGSMEIDGNDVTQKVAQAWLNPPLLTQSSYSSTCYLVAPSM